MIIWSYKGSDIKHRSRPEKFERQAIELAEQYGAVPGTEIVFHSAIPAFIKLKKLPGEYIPKDPIHDIDLSTHAGFQEAKKIMEQRKQTKTKKNELGKISSGQH